MPTATIDGRVITVNEEGFLTDPGDWDRALATALAARIGIELTGEHWKVIDFLRADHARTGRTPTARRIQVVGGISVRDQFALFPKKPAKKMAYIAGLPKPHGCV